MSESQDHSYSSISQALSPYSFCGLLQIPLTLSGSDVSRSPPQQSIAWPPGTPRQYLVCDEGQAHALQLASGLAEDKVVFLGLGDDEVELDLLS